MLTTCMPDGFHRRPGIRGAAAVPLVLAAPPGGAVAAAGSPKTAPGGHAACMEAYRRHPFHGQAAAWVFRQCPHVP